ncbi:hypothetical protein INT45_001553 [Circinella minor]|uniref:HAT C-terminal dimerisation domain-containing protein n=1 Tax=Circinella minor TaxID=1195481 RepID=A0A8H7RMM1_9FUNG|nr:hypothetical protein INT45_001553 [Circinella minor]
MLTRASLLQVPYNSVCSTISELQEFQLSDLEWTRISQVKSMLLKFWETTIELSASQSHATINTAIVHYNLIMDSLEDVESSDYLAELKRAARRGLQKLQRYYCKVDNTHIYAVATALDPHMKFTWWRTSGWEQEYQNMSQRMVRDAWGDFPKSVTMESEANEELRRLYSLYNTSDEHDELDDYLQERLRVPMLRKKGQKAPEFLYWEAQSQWPNLARMAAQYFAVPVTSTPSERCFSQTRLLLPYTRNRLSPETIQRLMLLDSWTSFNSEE